MSKRTRAKRFGIQRTDDLRYWSGDDRWVTSIDEAIGFRTKGDAFVQFVMYYPEKGMTLFNPVPLFEN